jgi:hypothetical protein
MKSRRLLGFISPAEIHLKSNTVFERDPCAASQLKKRANVASGSFATKLGRPCRVRFTPDSDRTADITDGPVRAICGHLKFLAHDRKAPASLRNAETVTIP